MWTGQQQCGNTSFVTVNTFLEWYTISGLDALNLVWHSLFFEEVCVSAYHPSYFKYDSYTVDQKKFHKNLVNQNDFNLFASLGLLYFWNGFSKHCYF